jgi:hypothetical protein
MVTAIQRVHNLDAIMVVTRNVDILMVQIRRNSTWFVLSPTAMISAEGCEEVTTFS